MSTFTCPACSASFALDGAREEVFCPSCGKRHRVTPQGLVRPASTDPLIGRTIAKRFKLLRKLGDGGMGAVYAAEQQPIGREVALKVIKKQFAEDKEANDRFVAEAMAVARLNHPNIVTMHDFGPDEEEGGLYIAMELINGVTLRQRLNKSPVPWSEGVRIASALCDALAAAHAVPIVHRDLKPENVMLLDLQGKAHVKLLDFGIAKLEDKNATATNVFVGTPGYIPPEATDGVKDPRGDLYALGVILFELVTGQAPFSAANAMALVMRHVHEPAPRARAVTDREVPPLLDDLIAELLAKRPQDRPQTAALVRERLDALLSLEQEKKQTPATPSSPPSPAGPARVIAGKYRLLHDLKSSAAHAADRGDYDLNVYRVYAALQEGLSKHVILKLFEKKGTLSTVDFTPAIADVQRLASLQSPHIARIVDSGIDAGGDADGALYVVNDVAQGEALDRIVARGPIAPPSAVTIALGVCAAFSCAHEQGFTHPGLEPSGVFVTKKDHAVVLDFGVAESVRLQVAKLVVDALKTKVLTTLPPGYTAPERHHRERTPKGDLYTLGVILYEMLTGKRLFERPTALAMLTAHAIDAPPRLGQPKRGVDEGMWFGLDALLRSLLAKDPQQRPESAHAVAERLQALNASRAP